MSAPSRGQPKIAQNPLCNLHRVVDGLNISTPRLSKLGQLLRRGGQFLEGFIKAVASASNYWYVDPDCSPLRKLCVDETNSRFR